MRQLSRFVSCLRLSCDSRLLTWGPWRSLQVSASLMKWNPKLEFSGRESEESMTQTGWAAVLNPASSSWALPSSSNICCRLVAPPSLHSSLAITKLPPQCEKKRSHNSKMTLAWTLCVLMGRRSPLCSLPASNTLPNDQDEKTLPDQLVRKALKHRGSRRYGVTVQQTHDVCEITKDDQLGQRPENSMLKCPFATHITLL